MIKPFIAIFLLSLLFVESVANGQQQSKQTLVIDSVPILELQIKSGILCQVIDSIVLRLKEEKTEGVYIPYSKILSYSKTIEGERWELFTDNGYPLSFTSLRAFQYKGFQFLFLEGSNKPKQSVVLDKFFFNTTNYISYIRYSFKILKALVG